MVRCGWDGGAGARRNALLRDGSAWGRQRVRAVWEREVGVVHDSARGEVDDGMRCWGAGDRVIFGWDVHLGSVSDERRRRVGRDALRCPIPRLVWADVHEGQGTECQRDAGRKSDRWAQEEQGEQGARCERHCVHTTGLPAQPSARGRCERHADRVYRDTKKGFW